jgi:uncharacterized protein (DUF362 family)
MNLIRRTHLRNLVSVVQSTYEDLYSNLQRGIELAAGIEISNNDSVAIKINMCDARTPETGTITHPLFLDAFLRYLRENFENLDIYVVESDATVVLADDFIQWFGFLPILERWDVQWWNLSHDEIIETKVDGHYLKNVPVPSLLTRSKLISLSKLKTNSLSKITTSLKNQFGCLPIVEKSVFHKHLPEVIVDANLAMTPIFSIVDGIVGMGGPNGPAFGVPIHAEAIFAGKDPVAVASASAEFMGFKPSRIQHIRLAESSGLGSTKFELVGDKVDKPDFERNKLIEWQRLISGALKDFMRIRSRQGWRRAEP